MNAFILIFGLISFAIGYSFSTFIDFLNKKEDK